MGTTTTVQAKQMNYLFTRTVHWIGSFWSAIGRPPMEVQVLSEDSYRRYWDDTVSHEDSTRNWRSLIREGHNATTNLTGSKQKLDTSPGNLQYTVKWNEGTSTEYWEVFRHEGDLTSPYAALGGYASEETAVNQAAMAFYKKAREVQTEINSGVIAGEAAQTIRGILQMVRTIRNGMSGYLDSLAREKAKRGRRRRLREHSRREVTEYISDQWLSYSFGIKPLLSDLDDSMKYLATDPEVLSPSVEIRAKGQDVGKGFVRSFTGPAFSHDVNVEEEISVRFHGKVSRNVSGFALFGDAMSARAGLDPSNWLPTIWELIPYSFVVDYFSNVQEVISSYTFNQESILWVNRTIRHVIKSRPVNTVPHSIPFGAVLQIENPGDFTWTRTTVQRDRGNGPGQVSLAFQIPGLGSTKWLNMAALLAKSKSMSPYVW